ASTVFRTPAKADSKVMLEWRAAVPRPMIGAVTPIVRVRPAPVKVCSVPERRCSACERALSNSVASMPSVANSLKTSPSPTACPPFLGLDAGRPVQPAERAAHAVDGGAALLLAHRDGRRRAVLRADALGVVSEGLVLL